MTPIEKIQLWRCPCGTFDSPGKGETYPCFVCGQIKEPITYVPLEQVLEKLEVAAAEQDALADRTKGTPRTLYHVEAATIRRFASELKGAE